jgi:hypothetical protein
MAVFDITPLILGHAESIWDRGESRRNKLSEVRAWLNDHVGEYYGKGEDPILDIGSGWEIFVMHNGKIGRPRDDEDSVITWHLDITDSAKSTHFALVWVK